MLLDFLTFLHVITVVFMAVPLFNLIVVNERVMFGSAPIQVDLYFENIIRGGAKRCFVFQLTAFLSGLALVGLGGDWSSLYLNWVLLAKMVLLATLTGLLSLVHFSIQPRIDALLSQVKGEAIPPEIAAQVGPVRGKRKRLASVCLFLVVTTVMLGLQTSARFHPALTLILLALTALFAWRVFKSRIPYGWF